MNNNELRHYGILGMKWGVRRTPAQLARARGKTSSSSESVHEDYKKAHDNKSIKSMSDAELRSKLNRIQMEQQYSRLNPGTVTKGKNTVNKILKTAGTVAATTGTILTLYNNINKISGLGSVNGAKVIDLVDRIIAKKLGTL